MKYMKKMLILGVMIISAVSMASCKPSYKAPVEAPNMTTMAADAPYDMDFVQLNNDVIDVFSRKTDVFPFINDLEIDGDNEQKTIEVKIDVHQGISDEAVLVLLSDVTKQIANNAYIQDFRLKKADDTQFGSVYDIYSYTYKVTSGGETLYDETIPAGGEIPLDPSVDGDVVKEALEQMTNEESSDAEESTSATN
ncbi:hypothetical protein [Oribacterium sp. P9]|uniref:hypothetical protein n=1 Tax=Oribacterium sp. P9 TaxID=3378068 RepID=UPI003966BA8E